MQTSTVIKCLELLFSMTGMPDYIYSDRGRSFISQELKEYLLDKGVATSNSMPYHPQGNGQAKRYVGVVWKTIQLVLKSLKLSDKHWDQVLKFFILCGPCYVLQQIVHHMNVFLNFRDAQPMETLCHLG